MSTPAEQHPIDPISLALGRLDGRFDEFQKHVDTRFAAVDTQFAMVYRLIGGLYALVLIGFAGLAWLTTHH
jgi:hypothetical protein